jgi:hypothetical protein
LQPNLWGGVRVEVTIISVTGITLKLHIEENVFLFDPKKQKIKDLYALLRMTHILE